MYIVIHRESNAKKVVFGNEPVFIHECQRILVIKIYSTTI
jgi:hypothetical protein